MGKFKIKSKMKLSEMNVGDEVSESDFASIMPDGSFVQLEYFEEDEKIEPYKVKPGVWTIQKTMAGLKLDPTSFVEDKILSEFIHTENITNKINCFFTRLHVYKKHGIEVPRRALLMYGPAGTGKSTVISKVSRDYIADGKTAVILWGTDKIEAADVKNFFKSFQYEGVDKVIFVMEDIGGVEVDQVRMKSTSSLLALLDNQEKAFKIATFILATTNHPENFLGNLTNRPGRFDDKVEVNYPDGKARSKLLQFFLGEVKDEAACTLIESKKYQEFSPAHIKEAIIRADLYDKTLSDAIDSIQKEIDVYKKNFDSSKGKLGIGSGRSFDYDD